MVIATHADERPVRAALMQKLRGDGLCALGVSVARVVELASSDDQGTHDLAYHVLADAALTQKILCLANTLIYRGGGPPVTTVSRAITLLGFDNVKVTALALLLVDTLLSGAQGQSVRTELEASLCASLVGREVARLRSGQNPEEASIGALFKNIGALLIASQEHERYREICALVAGGHTQAQASQMILGCSFDTLSAAVLRDWKIPEPIVRSLATLAPGVQKAPVGRSDWLRQVATFSVDLAKLLGRKNMPAGADPALSDEGVVLFQRFGAALDIEFEQMRQLCSTVQAEMAALLQSMNIGPPAPAEEAGAGLPNVLSLAALDGSDQEPANPCHPSGKPLNARELLQAGVRELTQMRLAGQSRVNQLILTALETLHRSLGLGFSTVCLKDVKTGQYRARHAFGEARAERQAGFAFPLIPENDLFHLAMENNSDLIIGDARGQKIQSLLPAWHRALLPDARSFVVLPLVVRSVQLGLFYGDRAQAAPEGVSAEEMALIAALKEQVLIALSP
jgi:HD-like signal output (HDOD) protein